jgi:hypothetical protein
MVNSFFLQIMNGDILTDNRAAARAASRFFTGFCHRFQL